MREGWKEGRREGAREAGREGEREGDELRGRDEEEVKMGCGRGEGGCGRGEGRMREGGTMEEVEEVREG